MQEIKAVITLCDYEECMYLCVCFHSELSRIREHDAFVSQEVEHAHQQLAEALEQTRTDSEWVPHRTKLKFTTMNILHIMLLMSELFLPKFIIC